MSTVAAGRRSVLPARNDRVWRAISSSTPAMCSARTASRLCFALFDRHHRFGAVRPRISFPMIPRHRTTCPVAKPPSAAAWFGNRSIGPDNLQPRPSSPPARQHFIAGAFGRAGILMGGARPHRRRLCCGGWTEPTASSGASPTPSWRFPLFVLAMASWRARQHRAKHHHRDAIVPSALAPGCARRGQCAAQRRFVQAARLSGMAVSGFCWCISCRTSWPIRSCRCRLADHRARHPQCRRPVLHRPRFGRHLAEWGITWSPEGSAHVSCEFGSAVSGAFVR